MQCKLWLNCPSWYNSSQSFPQKRLTIDVPYIILISEMLNDLIHFKCKNADSRDLQVGGSFLSVEFIDDDDDDDDNDDDDDMMMMMMMNMKLYRNNYV